jgi:hypothetical protein
MIAYSNGVIYKKCFCLDKLRLIDIVVYVFEQKHYAPMRDRKILRYFGEAIGHVHVIGFQKQRLPHMSFLIFLIHEDKIREAAQVCCTMCAEFPHE